MNRRLILSRIICWLVLAVPIVNWLALGQTVIRVRSERVLLDVLVFDSDNRFVSDLTAADFEVLENQIPRPVTNLVLINKGQPAASMGHAWASEPELEPSESSEEQLQEDFKKNRLIAVLDRVSTSPADYNRAITALETFIKRLPWDTEVSLLTFNGRLELLQSFTDHRRRLLKALDEARRVLPVRQLEERQQIQEEIAALFTERLALGFQVTDTTDLPGLLQRTLQDAIRRANEYLMMVDLEITNFFSSMRRLLRSLHYVEGDKSIVLFSRGYSMLQGDDFKELLRDNVRGRIQGLSPSAEMRVLAQTNQVVVQDYHQELSELIGLANRNGIRIHTLNPGRLQALAPGGEASESASFYQLTNMPERKFFRDLEGLTRPLDSLVSLSTGTNGIAVHNRNRLADHLFGILERTSRYYLLGYEPSANREPDKFYEVTVKVKRAGDFKVIAEQGYLHFNEDRQQRRLEYALAFPGLFREIPFESQLATFHQGQGPITCISLEIPGDSMPFRRSVDGSYHATLEIYGVFLNSRGEQVEDFVDSRRLQLTGEDYQHYRTKSFVYFYEVRLPPGDYQLRAIIKDSDSDRLGADLQRVRVAPKDPGISLSDIILSQGVQWAEKDRSSPLLLDNYKIIPEGNRSVRLNEPLLVYFRVYNLDAQKEQVSASARFLLTNQDQKILFDSRKVPLPRLSQAPEGIPVSYWIPTSQLSIPAGVYYLKVEVTDQHSGRHFQDQIEIEFEPSRPSLQ